MATAYIPATGSRVAITVFGQLYGRCGTVRGYRKCDDTLKVYVDLCGTSYNVPADAVREV